MGNFEINFDRQEPSGGVVEIRGGRPGRGVVAIVAGLLVVVVLVVALGRSRDKSVAELPTTTLVQPTTIAVGASTTTTAASTTTSSAATTTTTVAAVQVFGPLLPDKSGASLFVVQADADLVQIDVDSGTVTNLLPGLRVENTYQMFALSHGVVIRGESQPRLVVDGEITNVGTVDQMIGTPDGIHILAVSYFDTGTELVSIIPGGPREPTVALPAGSDPVAVVPGAVLLQSRAGGVYVFDVASGGVRKVAEGAFIALKGERLASLACDDSMKCHISVGPLGGRPQHQVPVDPQGFNLAYAYFYGQSLNALSPTRDLLAYTTQTQRGPTNVVLDLATGKVVLSVTLSTGGSGPAPFVWSADGRWLFWVDRGKVMAWSPDRGGDPVEFANAEAGSAQMIAAGYSA
jgi:hypothetical protein